MEVVSLFSALRWIESLVYAGLHLSFVGSPLSRPPSLTVSLLSIILCLLSRPGSYRDATFAQRDSEQILFVINRYALRFACLLCWQAERFRRAAGTAWISVEIRSVVDSADLKHISSALTPMKTPHTTYVESTRYGSPRSAPMM
ncbi:hypothetical protein K474DRAFT_1493002 [Panus rudis PR-1116 ss-1]|nr:hypothetical protein K474DRAFT_1493002 [Panus rudis PR-1116 ss-1]